MAVAENTEQRLNSLKQKYASVLSLIQQQGVRLAHMHVQDGKLFLQGEAPSQEAKNKIWDQIKLVDPQYSDLTADFSVQPGAPSTSSGAGAAATTGTTTGTTPGGTRTYIVQPGDTLSKISKQFYGDANRYMEIFEANRNTLSDPDKIRAGQTLNIPIR
jgi:nucleoid-associated protein YgaU